MVPTLVPFLFMLSSDSNPPLATEKTTDSIPNVQTSSSYASNDSGFSNESGSFKFFSVSDQIRFFSPQGADAIREIGPIDAAACGIIGIGLAEYYAYQKFPGQDISTGNRNAYRHCYGSCLSYQAIGEDALIAMDIHEKYGPENKCDHAIDMANNSIGVSWAKSNPHGSCLDYCDTAIIQGRLSLDCSDVGVFNSSQIETVLPQN